MAEDMPDDAGGLSVQTWECRRRGWEEEKQGRGTQAMATANAVIHERRMRNNAKNKVEDVYTGVVKMVSASGTTAGL